MASKGGRTKRGKKPTTSTTTTTQLKNKKKIINNNNNNNNNQGIRRINMRSKITEEIEASRSSAMAAIESSSSSDFEECCCTPKADRFQIPKIKICPPAPKKQRLFSNCSLQRSSPIALFASPDIDLFFFFSQSH